MLAAAAERCKGDQHTQQKAIRARERVSGRNLKRRAWDQEKPSLRSNRTLVIRLLERGARRDSLA